MKIAFTGHRPQRLYGQNEEIGKWIKETLENLKSNYQIDLIYSGMAQGVDQIAAMKVIELGLPLSCAYPYPHKIFAAPQETYINEHATQIIFVSPQYQEDCFVIRDRYMVDHADLLIAVWDGKEYGGTWETIKYAEKKGIPIVKRMIYADT